MATGSSVNDTRASQLSSAGIRLMTIEASIPSHIDAIAPLVERLMQLIGRSRSAAGNEFAVELALREALRISRQQTTGSEVGFGRLSLRVWEASLANHQRPRKRI